MARLTNVVFVRAYAVTVPSDFAHETARIYSEMYEEGVEPMRPYIRMSPIRGRAAWRNFAILMLVGIVIVVLTIAYAISRLG